MQIGIIGRLKKPYCWIFGHIWRMKDLPPPVFQCERCGEFEKEAAKKLYIERVKEEYK